MKEYTVVHTVQFTEIVKADELKLIPIQQTENRIKSVIDVDDVKVTSRQIFIRDLPNESEVVVETP